MKNVLRSLGKVLLYFLMYIFIKGIVSSIISIVLTSQIIMKSDTKADIGALTELITKIVMDYSALMALIAALLTILILIIFFAARKKNFTKEVSFRKISIKTLILPALLSISFFLCITFLITLLPIPIDMMEQYSQMSNLLFGNIIIIACASLVIFTPAAEEIIFRGIILSRLSRGMQSDVSAIISSLLFALTYGVGIQMAYMFVLGLLLCYICIKYRSILASYVMNLIFSLSSFIMHYVIPKSIPTELSIALFMVGVVGCLGLIRVISKNKTIMQETLSQPR